MAVKSGKTILKKVIKFINMASDDVTSGQLLQFLKQFQDKVEIKMEATNKKIDDRLNNVDKEIDKVNVKIDENEKKADAATIRMDRRLTILEKEMAKVGMNRRRNEELREKESWLKIQPQGRRQTENQLREEAVEKVNKVAEDILKEPAGIFRSSWAKGIQMELRNAAEMAEKENTDRVEAVREVTYYGDVEEREGREETGDQTPDNWEDRWGRQELFRDGSRRENYQEDGHLGCSVDKQTTDGQRKDGQRKEDSQMDGKLGRSRKQAGTNVGQENGHQKAGQPRCTLGGLPLDSQTARTAKTKVRKPIVITQWFGDETTTEESDSDEATGWQSVDRKQKNIEKKKKLRKRKKEKEGRVAYKASCMATIGPMDSEYMNEEVRKGGNYEEVKISTVKRFLEKNLGYIKEELEALNIRETKYSWKGEKLMNVAMDSQEDIRELFIRKAESRNDRIVVRNYCPPGYYERFKELNKRCTEMRVKEPKLKTQLRFGRQGIELYTKYKGEEAGYKLTRLEDVMNTEDVPQFSHEIKWKRMTDRPPRRKVIYGRPDKLQDTEQPAIGQPGMIRANSNSTGGTMKRVRLNASSSSSSDDEEEEEEDEEEEGEMELVEDPLLVMTDTPIEGNKSG